MAISYVGGASGSAINAGSVTVTLPAGMQVDDLILVAYSCGDDDFTQPALAMTTAGYTELTTSTLSADGGTLGDGNLAIFYKFHNGSDTNVVTAASGTGADSSNAVAVLVFRGVAKPAQGGPLEIAIATASNTTGGDPDPPQVSGFDEATAVVVIAGASSGIGAGQYANPTGYATNSLRIDAPTETFRASVGMAYREDPADPENPPTFNGAHTGAWCAATLVLKEATAAAGQDLTGSLFSRAASFAAATVTALKTLPGSVFSQAPSFAAGSITSIRALSGSLFSKAPSFPAGAIGIVGGQQSLSGSLFSKAPSFASASLTSVRALTGSAFQRAPSFPAGTVTSVRTLPGSAFQKAPAFGAGAISQIGGTQSLSGSAFQRAASFPAATVTATRLLSGSAFQKAPSFAAATLTSVRPLSGSLFLRAPSFPAGVISIQGGPLSLGGAVFQRAPSFGAGVVSRGPVALSGSRYQKAPSFAAASLTSVRLLSGSLLLRAPSFGAGAVSSGAVNLVGSAMARAPFFPFGIFGEGEFAAPVVIPGRIRRSGLPTGDVYEDAYDEDYGGMPQIRRGAAAGSIARGSDG
jgi:hypothetical protein